MEKHIKIIRLLFAVPWLVFGWQHFLYADFVAALVPAFMPIKLFWAYLTGAAMIAAGISFIVHRFASLAAILLGVMLTIFILLIHVPAFLTQPFTVAALTRPLQDVTLACSSFLLGGVLSNEATKFIIPDAIAKASRYIFASMLIGFGIEQFYNLDFLTAKIPPYFPIRAFWVYPAGMVMILAAVIIIVGGRKTEIAANALGWFLLIINILNHGYLLANNPHEPLLWTAAMLDLAITTGVFILASSVSTEQRKFRPLPH